MIELRKRRIEADMEGGDTPSLPYTIIPERKNERIGRFRILFANMIAIKNPIEHGIREDNLIVIFWDGLLDYALKIFGLEIYIIFFLGKSFPSIYSDICVN